jgi:hypothetical protein
MASSIATLIKPGIGTPKGEKLRSDFPPEDGDLTQLITALPSCKGPSTCSTQCLRRDRFPAAGKPIRRLPGAAADVAPRASATGSIHVRRRGGSVRLCCASRSMVSSSAVGLGRLTQSLLPCPSFNSQLRLLAARLWFLARLSRI